MKKKHSLRKKYSFKKNKLKKKYSNKKKQSFRKKYSNKKKYSFRYIKGGADPVDEYIKKHVKRVRRERNAPVAAAVMTTEMVERAVTDEQARQDKMNAQVAAETTRDMVDKAVEEEQATRVVQLHKEALEAVPKTKKAREAAEAAEEQARHEAASKIIRKGDPQLNLKLAGVNGFEAMQATMAEAGFVDN